MGRPDLNLIGVCRQAREACQVKPSRTKIDLRIHLVNLWVREVYRPRVYRIHGVHDAVLATGRVHVTRVLEELELGDGQRRSRAHLHRDRAGQDSLQTVVERRLDRDMRVVDRVPTNDRGGTEQRVGAGHSGRDRFVGRLDRLRTTEHAHTCSVARYLGLDVVRRVADAVARCEARVLVHQLLELRHCQDELAVRG